MRNIATLITTAVSSALLLANTGCSTTRSTEARPLRSAAPVQVDLSRYTTVTVTPFDIHTGVNVDRSVGARFAEDIAIRLRHDFGPLFTEVRTGTPATADDELVVAGTIRKYRAGSKFARAITGLFAAAELEGDIVLRDAASGRVLYMAPFDKMWGWGGMLGASKGIDDMMTETAAAVANTVARAKGWNPPPR